MQDCPYKIILEYSERGALLNECTYSKTEQEALRILSERSDAVSVFHNDKLLKVKEKDGIIRDPIKRTITIYE